MSTLNWVSFFILLYGELAIVWLKYTYKVRPSLRANTLASAFVLVLGPLAVVMLAAILFISVVSKGMVLLLQLIAKNRQ